MPDSFLSCITQWERERTSGGREPRERKTNCALLIWKSNDTVPGSGGSQPRTAWEQMEYGMFPSEIKANKKIKGKAAQISTSWSALPTPYLIQSSLKSTESVPLISNRFNSEPKEGVKNMAQQKARWHHGSVGRYGAQPEAICVYQMLLFLGLPLRHVPSSKLQWKDLKYHFICIYLTEKLSILPDDLWFK